MRKMCFLLALLLLLTTAFATPAPDGLAVDLDLSIMPASIAYAQAVSLQQEPETYAGQMLRVSGVFNYSQLRERGVVIVMDNSGCCETSLEFTRAGAPAYSEDFPELYSRITVVGCWQRAEETDGAWILQDAVVEE